MSDLREAVDALTLDHVEHLPQRADDGAWLRVHTVVQPAALARLAAAVASSTGSGGRRSGSDRWAMNVLDSDALFQAAKIRAAITDWCRLAGVPVTKDLVRDLRAWCDAVERGRPGPEWERAAAPALDGYVERLRGWLRSIEAKLDPPRRVELRSACPVCGATHWESAEGISAPFPLVVEYHDYGTAESVRPRAVCRACRIEWDGLGAIEELGEELGTVVSA